jgi:hypothetical protein
LSFNNRALGQQERVLGLFEMICLASAFGGNRNMLRDALWGGGMSKLNFLYSAGLPRGKDWNLLELVMAGGKPAPNYWKQFDKIAVSNQAYQRKKATFPEDEYEIRQEESNMLRVSTVRRTQFVSITSQVAEVIFTGRIADILSYLKSLA